MISPFVAEADNNEAEARAGYPRQYARVRRTAIGTSSSRPIRRRRIITALRAGRRDRRTPRGRRTQSPARRFRASSRKRRRRRRHRRRDSRDRSRFRSRARPPRRRGHRARRTRRPPAAALVYDRPIDADRGNDLRMDRLVELAAEHAPDEEDPHRLDRPPVDPAEPPTNMSATITSAARPVHSALKSRPQAGGRTQGSST